MQQHFHLLIGCIEAVLGFIVSVFLPRFAFLLLIPINYVPTLQGIAAIASITLVAYTFGKEIYHWLKKRCDYGSRNISDGYSLLQII